MIYARTMVIDELTHLLMIGLQDFLGAVLQCLELPYVFDGDSGLGSEGFDQGDLLSLRH